MKFFSRRISKIAASVVSVVMLSCLSVFAVEQFDSCEVTKQREIESKAADTVDALQLEKLSMHRADLSKFKKTTTTKYTAATTKSSKNAVIKRTSSKNKKIGDFKVAVPADSTEVFEFDPEPLNFYYTRDFSNEYYTVYDENLGRNVTLDAFELVCRIVYNEISDSWGSEAIKAQAVAAYSYVRFNDEIGNVPTVGLRSGYSDIISQCVKSVEGQAVTFNGNTINAVYSASTAGVTVNSGDMWGVQYPYLLSVVSPYDENDPYYGLRTEFSPEQVKTIIESKTDIKLSDDIKNWFEFDSVYSRKYIGRIKIDGHSSCNVNESYVDLTAVTLVNILGLQSNALEIEYINGKFVFTTYGWGHGVGMSQWGACYYANAGYTYDQILMHYYLDTQLTCTYENEKAVQRGIEFNAQAVSAESKVKSEPVSADMSKADSN